MAQNSKIEWTHHTANLWHGCTEVHEGCDNCYAKALDHRWGRNSWGNDSPRRVVKSVWNDLEKYQKLAHQAGEMHRVFVGSMMDIFEKRMRLVNSKGETVVGTTDSVRQRLFSEISDGKYPNLHFLFLTKRPSNINKYIPDSWKENPPPNVMFGTSPVNQETANTIIPQLLKVKGKKFLSIEPMLNAIDLSPFLGNVCGQGGDTERVSWVIVGGESGPKRRHFDLAWARSIQEQCKQFNVPFFFKQIDKVREKTDGIPPDLMVREFPIIPHPSQGTCDAKEGETGGGQVFTSIEK